MQAAHEYYLQHATSEVGHRSPICSPCLRLLRAARSADRSSGPQPDGAQRSDRFVFFFLRVFVYWEGVSKKKRKNLAGGRKTDGYFRRDARKVIPNVCCNSGRGMIGSVRGRARRQVAPRDRDIRRAAASCEARGSIADVRGCFRLISHPSTTTTTTSHHSPSSSSCR